MTTKMSGNPDSKTDREKRVPGWSAAKFRARRALLDVTLVEVHDRFSKLWRRRRKKDEPPTMRTIARWAEDHHRGPDEFELELLSEALGVDGKGFVDGRKRRKKAKKRT